LLLHIFSVDAFSKERQLVRRNAIVFGAFLIVGCGSHSSTAPNPKLIVTVTGPSVVQGHDSTISQVVYYVCYVPIIAAASGGEPGQVATWGGGHYTQQGAPGQIVSAPIAAVAPYFYGKPDVPTGTQVNGEIISGWAAGSFSGSQTFYYSTPEEQIDSTTYSYACQ
jgi:hypothetical protein